MRTDAAVFNGKGAALFDIDPGVQSIYTIQLDFKTANVCCVACAPPKK